MNGKSFVFLAFCLTGLFSSSESYSYQKSEEEGRSQSLSSKAGLGQETRAFFNARLSGEKKLFQISERIRDKSADEFAAQVWNTWKEANCDLDEEKLIPMTPLSDSIPGMWHLPDSLEPDADMPYYFGTKGRMPEEGYPLFVYLHGSGRKDAEWAAGFRICNMFKDAPSLYFIPQIPNTGPWYRWWQQSKQYAWEKLIRQVFLMDEVNQDRIYFLGVSEGGYGSQRLASFYADYLAAAGPMAGGEPLKNAPAENCASIGFSLRTGAKDYGFARCLLTGYVKEHFDSLEISHPGYFRHWVDVIPERGHGIDYRPTSPWLSGFKRNPWPSYVAWEDFSMDGRRREGFYNIQVLDRSCDAEDSRTYYEMSISDNKVSVSVSDVEYSTVETIPGTDIAMKFARSYSPSGNGRFIVYLNSAMVDVSKPVTVEVNGSIVFKGRLKADIKNMVNSCAVFFDPARVFPYAVEVVL